MLDGSEALYNHLAPCGPWLSCCKYKSLFSTENFRIFMMRKFRLSVLGKLYKSWERIFLVAIRATELFCSGQGAMAEAPNLEGILAPLLLRVARLEAHVTTMDLPFVEDRLDNMETVVAALGREFDALAQRLEELQRQIRDWRSCKDRSDALKQQCALLKGSVVLLMTWLIGSPTWRSPPGRKRREPWNTIRLFSRNWTIGLQALSHQPIQTTLEVLSQERHQQVCIGRGLIMLASVLDHRTVRPEVYVAFQYPIQEDRSIMYAGLSATGSRATTWKAPFGL